MKKIIYFLLGFIGFVIISIAMQSSQLNFDRIIREFKGEEETKEVLYLIVKFLVAILIGLLLIYYFLKKTFQNLNRKYIIFSLIALFVLLFSYRIYHFINYDENKLINRTDSKNWIMNFEEAIYFYTPEGMDKLHSDENNMVKSYKDDNLTILFAEEKYNNYSKKADINVEKTFEILRKQVFDITKLNISEYKVIEQNNGVIKKIVLEMNLNNRGLAYIYAIERNSDITTLTIFTKNTENSKTAYREFMKNFKMQE